MKRILHMQFTRTNRASGCLRRVEHSAFDCQRAAPLFQSLVVKSGHRQEQPPPSHSSIFLSVPYSPSVYLSSIFPLISFTPETNSSPIFYFILSYCIPTVKPKPSPASLSFLIGCYPSFFCLAAPLRSHCLLFSHLSSDYEAHRGISKPRG